MDGGSFRFAIDGHFLGLDVDAGLRTEGRSGHGIRDSTAIGDADVCPSHLSRGSEY